MGEFERVFGQLDVWPLAEAVRLFFTNGGTTAIIVRVAKDAKTAHIALPAGGEQVRLEARNPGAWGNRLRVRVGHARTTDENSFNLRIELQHEDGSSEMTEVHADASMDPRSPRYLADVLAARSELIRLVTAGESRVIARPDASPQHDDGTIVSTPFSEGSDGAALEDAQISGSDRAQQDRGLWALNAALPINLLCIPPLTKNQDVGLATWVAALAYCRKAGIFLLVDPPANWLTANDVARGLPALNIQDAQAALYWPRVLVPPSGSGTPEPVAPSGAIAGIYARTDLARGVWKAPAGVSAQFRGVVGLTVDVTGSDHEALNKVNANALRVFDRYGPIVWGARTLAVSDFEWRYVSARRTALFIEQSLQKGLQWTAFEPNGEDLWAAVRLAVTVFMQSLFRAGAFAGYTSEDAFFVNCGWDTHTRADRMHGRLKVRLGFASVRPEEFNLLWIEKAVLGS